MKQYYLPVLFLVGVLWPIANWHLMPLSQRDFGVFWIAGRAVMSGIDPYDVEALRVFGDHLLGVGKYNFPYPPHALFLFIPFSMLPSNISFVVWDLASALFFWWAARPFVPRGMPSIWALLTPAGLINFNFGQTGLISAGLFLLAFRGNGLAAAALTFKPHLGVLVIPAVLRERRVFVTTVIGTLTLVAASALIFHNWAEFIAHAVGLQGKMLVDQSQIQWLIVGTTPAHAYGMWGWLIYAAGATYFLIRNYNWSTAATATFLISPYGLHYDMAAVCLGFAIMLHSRWEDMPMAHKVIASMAFLSPVIVSFGTAFLIPPILLFGLFVQTKWTNGIRLKSKTDRHGGSRSGVESTTP